MAGNCDWCVDAGVHVGGMGKVRGVALSGVTGAAQHEAKRNDALLTPISGLPEIGTHIRASRVNPTCVDRYEDRLREGPGSAAHHSPMARADIRA